jgi:hypothetical protein
MATIARHPRLFHLEPRATRRARARSRARAGSEAEERPLWVTIALLYASLAVIVGVVIALVFASSWLVAGHPY